MGVFYCFILDFMLLLRCEYSKLMGDNLMKAVINVLLLMCVGVLVYLCYASIRAPLRFDELRRQREVSVKARLLDIRKAQAAYYLMHGRRYTSSFDTLIHFVRTARLPFVYKEGELPYALASRGLTEEEAARMVCKARRRGDTLALRRWGLERFHRDTFWVALLDTLYPRGFRPDSLRYIPFGNGAAFEMETSNRRTPFGLGQSLLEVRAPADVYLRGLNPSGIADWKKQQEDEGHYAGLKIGDLNMPDNNAGNWE